MNILAAAALVALATAASAVAVPIAVTSYSMLNGTGNASGGTFNYWDRSYTGTGAATTDGATLSGGTGDLTDGYAETQSWNLVENGAGIGPYVGWRSGFVTNPTVTFNFAGTPTITSIGINLDNSGIGGVFAPSSILIDGVDTAFTAPTGVGLVSFTGLNLTGSSHTIQFVQNGGGNWAFVSEVGFAGSAVPEPAAWALMITGFAMVGASARRRRALLAA